MHMLSVTDPAATTQRQHDDGYEQGLLTSKSRGKSHEILETLMQDQEDRAAAKTMRA